MAELREVHIDQRLSRLSIQYKNDEFIWDQVLPVTKVGKRSNKYTVYNKRDTYKLVDDSVAPHAFPTEITESLSTDNYSVEDHALAQWVEREQVDEADAGILPLIDANNNVMRELHLQQEKRVADLVFKTSSYDAGNVLTLASNARWDKAAGDPIANIEDQMAKCFMTPNTLVFGFEVWLALRRHPKILDAVKQSTRQAGQTNSTGGLAMPREIMELFGVSKILVGKARYDSANPGQSANYQRIWGKSMAALYVGPTMGEKVITFGKTFCETQFLTYRTVDGMRGVKGSYYVKVGWNSDQKIVAKDVGALISTAID